MKAIQLVGTSMMRNQQDKNKKVCVCNLKTGEVLRVKSQPNKDEVVSELQILTGNKLGHEFTNKGIKLLEWQFCPKEIWRQYEMAIKGIGVKPQFIVTDSETGQVWHIHFYQPSLISHERHQKTRKLITVKYEGVSRKKCFKPEQQTIAHGNKRFTPSYHSLNQFVEKPQLKFEETHVIVSKANFEKACKTAGLKVQYSGKHRGFFIGDPKEPESFIKTTSSEAFPQTENLAKFYEGLDHLIMRKG